MKSGTIFAVLLGTLTLAALPSAPAAQDTLVHPAPPGANPLIEEMLLLDKTFREVVSGVAVGDAERVSAALEAMHGAMEKTREGVRAGKVTIPKNAHRVREFLRLDRKFHGGLETLARAARADDRRRMLVLTKRLLDECVNCHRMFKR